MKEKIAIQGGKTSFHDIAAHHFFSKPIKILPCDSFREVFTSIDNGSADKAVIAIENSLYGSINEVYDLLLESKMKITGEIYLRIKQCLIGLPNSSLKTIKEVHSHPVALAQCHDFLDENLPDAEQFEHHDTALSVRDIAAWGDASKASIASQEAANLYGMKVIAGEIETNKQNYTRFVVLQNDPDTTANFDKISLVLTTHGDSRPGALHRALGVLKEHDLNMTLLHSRPILGKAWHYMFYVDVVDNPSSPQIDKAIEQLTSNGCRVSVLGRYQAGKTL